MNILRRQALYIYIALWMLYYLQWTLMINGIIAQMILAVLMLMSFYAFFQVNVYYRTCPYLKWLNVMLLVLSVYGLVPIIGGWTLTGSYKVGASWMTYLYLQDIYMSVLPIYAFYYFSLKKQITDDILKYAFFAYLFFSILMYYQDRAGRDEIINNAGYYFVPLIPMLGLIKVREIWKYVALAIILAYLMMAMKRGAILSGSVLAVLFLVHNLKNVSLKRSVFIIVLSVIAFYVIYHFTINLYENSPFFQQRWERTLSGDTSFRDRIWSDYLTYFIDQTTALEFMIGNGANATMALFGDYAHNDFLEFAINQGILGVLLYLIYWIVFIWEWKNFKGKIECKQALGDLIVAYFLIAIYSMSFNGMQNVAALCIGHCLAQNMRWKIIVSRNNGHHLLQAT